MPLNFNEVAVDQELAKAGSWVTWLRGSRFKIARINNPKHRARLQQLIAEVRQRGIAFDFAVESQTRLEVEARALADAVLLDWEGIVGDDGAPVPYTTEAGYSILIDPAHDDFVDFIVLQASRIENFRRKAQEETAGK